jgi:molybdenum cofactor biosynthesis protein B
MRSVNLFGFGKQFYFLAQSVLNIMSQERSFIPLNIAVLTVSDTRAEANDLSGQTLVDRLLAAGHHLADKRIVPDNIYQIRATVSAWIADETIQAVITTGGTGVTGRDGTPEAISVLFDKTLDGFGEVFRSISFGEISTSTIQSRTLAGVANGTYLFCLPGSSSACRTAWDRLIAAQLDYRTLPCNLVELIPRLLEK